MISEQFSLRAVEKCVAKDLNPFFDTHLSTATDLGT
jgi:hypothetical protein